MADQTQNTDVIEEYEKYRKLYSGEADAFLMRYYRDSEGIKKKAIASLLYERGYNNFETVK